MSEASRGEKVFALSLGQILATFVSIAVAAILSRGMSYGDYATFRQTFLPYSLLAPFLALGIPQALFYFLPGQTGEWRRYLVESLFWVFLITFFFTLFLLLGGDSFIAGCFHNPDLQKTLFMLPLFIPASLVMGLLPPPMVVVAKVKTLAAFNIFSRLLIGGSTVAAFLFLSKGYAPSAAAQTVTTFFAGGVALFLLFKTMGKKGGGKSFSLSSATRLILFAGPLGVASMCDVATLEAGKVIAAASMAPEAFAIFVNGAIEVPLITAITGSISNVIFADLREHFVRGEKEQALALFRTAALKSAYILFPVVLFLLVLADDFMVLLYSSRYLASAYPFRVLLLLLPFRIVFYGPLFVAMGKPKVVFWRALSGIVMTTLLSLLFARFWGYRGVAWACVLSVGLYQYGFYLLSFIRMLKIGVGQLLPLQDLGKTLFFLIPSGLCLFLLKNLVLQGSAFSRLLISGVLFWSAVAVWWYGKLFWKETLLRIFHGHGKG